MNLQDKVTTFINRAQSKICALMLETSIDLNESYVDSAQVQSSIELLDVVISLQDEVLDWTDKEIESVIDYYTWKENLADVAVLSFEDKLTSIIIISNSQISNDWVAPFNALSLTVSNNQDYTIQEISRLDGRIDNLDFSNLVPQELIDEVEANTAAQHTHANKALLDALTQGKIDEIGLNTTHRNDASKHISTAERNLWNAKVGTADLTTGLGTKAATVHAHAISDITDLEQALIDRNPIPGPAGVDGITPMLQAGTIVDGAFSSTIDNTDPHNPILNLVIPKGVDGTDFHIDEYLLSSQRLSDTYNDSLEGYSILGIDTGILYFRNRFDDLGTPIPATTTSGWYSVQFVGENGWSPVICIEIINATRAVHKVIGWTGGTGDAPTIVDVYITLYGYSVNEYEAVNILGPQGVTGPQGKVMFPDASGDTATKALYNDELKDFVYLDTVLGLIYIKRSDISADWSDGYQWKGEQGNQGIQGEPGTGDLTSCVKRTGESLPLLPPKTIPIYNWEAVVDARGVAPTGFHVPTNTEYSTLMSYLGGLTVAGNKLKTVGLTDWADDSGADNSSGFSAKSTNFRFSTGVFATYSRQTKGMWTSTAYNSTQGYSVSLSSYSAAATIANSTKTVGLSVRCIKDDSIPSAGAILDESGNTYTEVVIGTQIWLVEDLRTVKFNNGDSIFNETDNATWAVATTGLLCYSNNISQPLYKNVVLDEFGNIVVVDPTLPPEPITPANTEEWIDTKLYPAGNIYVSYKDVLSLNPQFLTAKLYRCNEPTLAGENPEDYPMDPVTFIGKWEFLGETITISDKSTANVVALGGSSVLKSLTGYAHDHGYLLPDRNLWFKFDATSTNDVYGYRPNDIPVGEPGRWLELIPYGKNSIFLANAAAIRNVYNPAVDTTVIDGTTGFIYNFTLGVYVDNGTTILVPPNRFQDLAGAFIKVGDLVGVIPNAAITPGTYSSVTVDAKGLVTGGGNTPAANVITESTTAFPFTDLASKLAGLEAYAVKDSKEIVLSAVGTDATESTIVRKRYWRATFAFTLVSTPITAGVAPSGSTAIFDVHKNGVSIYSTKPSIDSDEFSTDTAATPAIITTTSFIVGDLIELFIDQVGMSTKGQEYIMTINYIRV